MFKLLLQTYKLNYAMAEPVQIGQGGGRSPSFSVHQFEGQIDQIYQMYVTNMTQKMFEMVFEHIRFT